MPTPELLANAGRSVSAAPDIGKRNSSVIMVSLYFHIYRHS